MSLTADEISKKVILCSTYDQLLFGIHSSLILWFLHNGIFSFQIFFNLQMHTNTLKPIPKINLALL